MPKKLYFHSLFLAYVLWLYPVIAVETCIDNDYEDFEKVASAVEQENTGVKEQLRDNLEFYKLEAQYASPKVYKKALRSLALSYKNGYGVEKNKDMSLTCYWRAQDFEKCLIAANKGNQHAQNALAYMYENGQGVGIDPFKAADYWGLSANCGLEDAKNQLQITLKSYEESMDQNLNKTLDQNDGYLKIINYIKEKIGALPQF